MKIISSCLFLLIAALLFGESAVQAAATPANESPRSGTNAPPASASETETPKSIFTIPNTPQEGRDPFFPNSTRLFAASIVKSGQSTVVAPKAEVFLKGISGARNRRLAIINNYTFAAGEGADVYTTSGRVRVRCLDIKADSVLVEVAGERRELRMRAGF